VVPPRGFLQAEPVPGPAVAAPRLPLLPDAADVLGIVEIALAQPRFLDRYRVVPGVPLRVDRGRRDRVVPKVLVQARGRLGELAVGTVFTDP